MTDAEQRATARKTMFSRANNYMEQFLYSFKRSKTILNTLTETATIFDEGETLIISKKYET